MNKFGITYILVKFQIFDILMDTYQHIYVLFEPSKSDFTVISETIKTSLEIKSPSKLLIKESIWKQTTLSESSVYRMTSLLGEYSLCVSACNTWT